MILSLFNVSCLRYRGSEVFSTKNKVRQERILHFMLRAFRVAFSYIPFITKYRKASRRMSRYYKTLRRGTRTTFRG